MPRREDYEAAGLLEDCDTADRIALLDWLSSLGLTIEDMATGNVDTTSMRWPATSGWSRVSG